MSPARIAPLPPSPLPLSARPHHRQGKLAQRTVCTIPVERARVPLQPYAATRSHAPWVREERAGAALGMDGRQGWCERAGAGWVREGLAFARGLCPLGAWAAELGGAGALGRGRGVGVVWRGGGGRWGGGW